MFDSKGFHLLDYLDFLVKRKVLLLKVFLFSLVVIYLAIFFLIEEQFEATAMIIPREEDLSSGASGLLRGMKGLPLGLGTKSLNSEMDLYKTIIYSRTTLEDLIREFDLVRSYKLDTADISYMEKAVKRLSNEITTKETEESALKISVRAASRQKAADMTNHVVRLMNERIIELKVSRSRENRMFLGKRVEEIKQQLKKAEDSLRSYQEQTGLLDVKAQLQGILSAHVSLETELTAKKFQQGILERLYDKESPQVKEMEMQIQEYQKGLIRLRSQGDPGSPFLPLNKLPQTSVEFLRRYREVELNSLVMEYVVPLYEQSKIEEKKDYPVLQVVDYAVPPAKKSYPPRSLFSLVGAISVTLFVWFFLIARESLMKISDPQLLSILREARRWTDKK